MNLDLKNYQATVLMTFLRLLPNDMKIGSLVITTNKPFEQWSEIFADQTLSQAILDRIVHYSTVIKITGNSYRAKNVKTKKE